MNIIDHLSSQTNDRTEKSNINVSEICLKEPSLLSDIATGFTSKSKNLKSDCIEVFTLVGAKSPQFIAPFLDQIAYLLQDKDNKTRWEAAHSMAYVAHLRPEAIIALLPNLEKIIENDKSIIVRDYTSDIIANLASAGNEYALIAYPSLLNILIVWEERHAKQALQGLIYVSNQIPELRNDIRAVALPYLEANKKTIIQAAKKLIKSIDNDK